MEIENFLVAIGTFFSIAQLTCVVTVSNYNDRLSSHFLKWYYIIGSIMVCCIYLTKGETISFEQIIIESIVYLLFLFFVYMFNSSLANRIESTKPSNGRS